jgi:lipid-binding SYLF domain-containing protein
MRFSKLLFIGAAFVSMLGASAYAQDKAAQQAEVKAKAMQALQDFYKADPKLKAAVDAAPGYAVFTTYGLSFGLGGAGGKGIAHNSKTKSDVYMSIAQASAGLQIGASDTRYLYVFNDAKSLADSSTRAGMPRPAPPRVPVPAARSPTPRRVPESSREASSTR